MKRAWFILASIMVLMVPALFLASCQEAMLGPSTKNETPAAPPVVEEASQGTGALAESTLSNDQPVLSSTIEDASLRLDETELLPMEGRPVQTQGSGQAGATMTASLPEGVLAKATLPKAASAEIPPNLRGPARISNLEFKKVDGTGRSRVLVKTDRPVTPQIMTKDNGRTVVLSLAPAVIDPGLLRPLNTTYFQSAVNYIQPATTRGKGVDVMIRLREVVPYQLGREGLFTYVDFDPSGVAPRTVSGEGSLSTELGPQGASSKADSSGAASGGGSGSQAPGLFGAKGQEAPPREGIDLSRNASASVTGAKGVVFGKEKVFTGAKVSLDFQNADIHNILRLIGDVSGKNIVVSQRVAGKVTLKLKEVPWDQALDIILTSNQLASVESGNVIRVDTVQTFIEEKNKLIEEQQAELARIQSVPLLKRVFTPKYRTAIDIAKEMEKLYISGELSKEVGEQTENEKRGRIAVIGNDIYVEADNDTMPQMIEVFNKLDIPTKQIMIESRIVEARTSFDRSLGVNWYASAQGTDSGNLHGGDWIGEGAVNLLDAPAYGGGFGFGLLSEVFNINAVLYASEAAGDVRIISAPRIMAHNDEEVWIKQGTSVPYETVSDQGTKIEFKDAVLSLKVKPHIENNGRVVTMDIEVTKDSPRYDISTTNPPIDTSAAKTRLMVKDGQTVVIGGIIQDEESKGSNRVPGVHKVPVFGKLFKSKAIEDTKSELLIFLTSHIVPVAIQ